MSVPSPTQNFMNIRESHNLLSVKQLITHMYYTTKAFINPH